MFAPSGEKVFVTSNGLPGVLFLAVIGIPCMAAEQLADSHLEAADQLLSEMDIAGELDGADTSIQSTKESVGGMLSFWRDHGFYTNPGEFETLYEGLPESLTELCELIKAQFIHPVADLPLYRNLLPPERRLEGEDSEYPTVRCLLAGLVTRNPAGLVYERRPEVCSLA